MKDWSAWDYISAPFRWLFAFYAWVFAGVGAVLVAAAGEMLAELWLDKFRNEKQYPLYYMNPK